MSEVQEVQEVQPVLSWQGNAIHILGIGAEQPAELGTHTTQALLNADIIIGSERHLKCISTLNLTAQCAEYPSPIGDLQQLLEKHQHKHIVILASGDPLFYGIGSYLVGLTGHKHLRFSPALSSIQLAFNKLGLSWQQAQIVSLHGRPLQRIRSVLGNQRLYAFLTDEKSSPRHIAEELKQARFDNSVLWVCEALGSQQEKVRSFTVAELLAPEHSDTIFNPLHVTIVKTLGQGGLLPEFPGIDDRLFDTGEQAGKGMISKREVRLAALGLLQPQAQDTAWDVGAGCGGLSIEWARWNPAMTLYAVEQHPQRIGYLKNNRDRFGVDENLHIVEGRAPEKLASLPSPNAVFIGGSGGELHQILEYCWQQLKPGGRLVASAVTEQTRATLLAFTNSPLMNSIESKWNQVQISRGDTLGNQLLLRPKAPVLLMLCQKPWKTDEHSLASGSHGALS